MRILNPLPSTRSGYTREMVGVPQELNSMATKGNDLVDRHGYAVPPHPRTLMEEEPFRPGAVSSSVRV